MRVLSMRFRTAWLGARARCIAPQDFDPEEHLERILGACTLPYIVTYRPAWEG